jgi:putative component of toxin-antitoxin plasmid stabilization module
MECELVKLGNLSGNKATIYSVLFSEINLTSYDNFILENKNAFKSELLDINNRLKVIGNKTGARDKFFKFDEGNLGDGVCALFDYPGKKLRLYCIRYGTLIVVIGGGGKKNVRKLQDDRKLTEENYFLRYISAMITERIRNREIWYSEDKMEFEGDLIFNDNQDD